MVRVASGATGGPRGDVITCVLFNYYRRIFRKVERRAAESPDRIHERLTANYEFKCIPELLKTGSTITFLDRIRRREENVVPES